MSREGWRPLEEELDRLDKTARSGFGQVERQDSLRSALARAAWTPAWILGAWVFLQVLARLFTADALRLAWWPILLVALGAFGLHLGFALGGRSRTALSRRRALSAWDRQLALQDRLTAADEFLQVDARSSFQEAAVADAAEQVEQTRKASLDYGATPTRLQDLIRPALAALVLCWTGALVGGWIAPISVEQGQLAQAPSTSGVDVEKDPAEPPKTEVEAVEAIAQTVEREEPQEVPATSETQAYATSVEEESKESEGKTGKGRSAAAESTTGAGNSQGSPSQQGQVSKPGKEKTKAERKKPKKQEAKPLAQPPKSEEQESGSTAGRGSSKGSNRNPATSDWSSKDHVNTPDDDDLEAEEETDDEEEEQEARGGMQPSLRDRRPPVSRELQIGFGNQPDPDANGRGGPSQPKKSRGTASLVLGVPIPDRVKGQPNPGKTKITQERIQPKVEQALPAVAEARQPRVTPGSPLHRQELAPWMRGLVREYFLAIRKQAQKP